MKLRRESLLQCLSIISSNIVILMRVHSIMKARIIIPMEEISSNSILRMMKDHQMEDIQLLILTMVTNRLQVMMEVLSIQLHKTVVVKVNNNRITTNLSLNTTISIQNLKTRGKIVDLNTSNSDNKIMHLNQDIFCPSNNGK